MLKVVLADDERKAILLMQKLIDWEKLGYEIVGIANDGISAAELVEQQQPHVLVTDIRMPGCDGIELIRRARELQPKLRVIVISGYRQFEYAQNALKYGVEDYLLKPLKSDELADILRRIQQKIGEQTELEYQLKRGAAQRQEILLSELMTAVEHGGMFLKKEQANEQYGFRFYDGEYMAVLIKPDISDANQHIESYKMLMQHSLEIVRRELDGVCSQYAVSVMDQGIAAVLNFDGGNRDILQCFTRIRKEIEKQRDLFWDIHVSICVGRHVECMQDLTLSMKEALWLCKDRICSRMEWKNSSPNRKPYITVAGWRELSGENIDFSRHYQMDSAQKRRFREAVEYLNAEAFEQELSESFRLVLMNKTLCGQYVEDWFEEVISVCTFEMNDDRRTEENFLGKLRKGFWHCTGVQEVFGMLRESFIQRINTLKDEKASQEAKPITDAKQYIQQHYREQLKLEDVSSRVGFNATYFSTLFKKETGQSFTDYLTELRINKAKEILCRDDIGVSDAAEAVGYKDLKYFSRLFKKLTGISPSDYKKLYR